MSSIVYLYDFIASKKKKEFTVQIQEREKTGDKWLYKGPKRIFYVNDIPYLKNKSSDSSLLKDAIQSELSFRKREGTFFKESDEITRLRIASEFLPVFLKKLISEKILINNDGVPLKTDLSVFHKPKIKILPENSSQKIILSVASIEFGEFDYFIPSIPVIAVKNYDIFLLHKNITLKLLESIPSKKEISVKDIDMLINRLSSFKDAFEIEYAALKQRKIIEKPIFYPVFNIEKNFHYAELIFEYEGGLTVNVNSIEKSIVSSDGTYEIIRNLEEEKLFVEILKKYGVKYQNVEKYQFYLPSLQLEKILKSADDESIEVRIDGKPLDVNLDFSWDVSISGKDISLKFEAHAGKIKAGTSDILYSIENNLNYIKLENGNLAFFPREKLIDFKALKNNGELSNNSLKFKDSDFMLIKDFIQNKSNVKIDSHFNALIDFEKNYETNSIIPLKESLNNVLRLYQKQGFNWLSNLYYHGFNGILSDDMGLGKTLEVISLLTSLKSSGKFLTSLVVVPKTLIYNFEYEMKKFSPDLSFYTHTGINRLKDISSFTDKDIIITTYGTLRADYEIISTFNWFYIILDESHAIKNPDAKISCIVKSIPAKHKLCITGTPVENKPLDLWSQFDFLMPGFLGKIEDFKEKYSFQNEENLKALNLRTKPYILRRLKNQVLNELPEKTEITIYSQMTESQENLYSKTLLKAKESFKNKEEIKDKKNRMHVFEIILRLRQIALHPALVSAGNEDTLLDSGKEEEIIETAKEILSEGHKILIFSSFTKYLKIVKKVFDNLNLKSFYLDGKTNNREKVIESFKGEKEPCVFFISLKAGGVGLNLTEANYVFLLDPWWNPSVENQAIDRCYRIGQEKHVTAYRFISKNTIEEKVEQLKLSKKLMTDALITETAIESISHITDEIIEDLLC